MAKPKSTTLPPIIFGQLKSQIDLDLFQMQIRVNAITNWVTEYDALNSTLPFQHRTAVFSSNGVRVIAVASTPTVMKVTDPDCTIAIPMFGALNAWVGGKHFTYAADSGQAMFHPPGKRHTEGGLKSTLLISMSPRRLTETVSAMLGEGTAQVDLHTPRLLHTTHGSTDLLKIIHQACSLVDQFHGNFDLLKNFAPDESIVRAVVMMLAPELFFTGNASWDAMAQPRKRVLDYLCEYIVGNLDQPLDLSKLELVSGMSVRMLQLEFKKRYATSPLQWVRKQRLAQAREMLQCANHSTTISAVAVHCGFDNFSDFARRYAAVYHELPSETLKKALSRA